MRGAVAVMLGVHGLIHVMGFLKLWQLAAVPQLTGRTIVPLTDSGMRIVGLLWLAAALALVVAALLCSLGRESWWQAGAVALALSQVLIVLQWHDAWAGTAVNALLLLAVSVGWGTAHFHQDNHDRAVAFLASSRAVASPSATSDLLRDEDLGHLPPPVQRWLRASGAVGRPRAHTVRLRQRGGLRTDPRQGYMPTEALQYFTVDQPGFVWTVDVRMMRMIPIVGRDSYVDGRGRMFIKAGGLIVVADGTGPKIDQGAALRFLGEIVWFPSAALAPYISWAPRDDHQAEATMTFGGVTVSAIFEFDDAGRFRRLTAQRYYQGDSLQTWVIPATEWRVVRGIDIPVRGGAVWKMAEGDFDYYQWEIVDVETNVTALWGEG